MSEIGDRIRAARERMQLTQAELAEKVGVSRATVSNWEQGVSPRSSGGLIRDVLGLNEFFLPRDRSPVSEMTDSELGAHLNQLIAQVNEASAEVARRFNKSRI